MKILMDGDFVNGKVLSIYEYCFDKWGGIFV